jgi:hypothetical protein
LSFSVTASRCPSDNFVKHHSSMSLLL